MPGQSVLVVQYGARRQYAVPAALARAGMLEALYTDACADRGLMGRMAALLAHGPAPVSVRKLAARRPPDVVLAKTRTFETWQRDFSRAQRFRDPYARVKAIDAAHRAAGAAMITAGFGSSTHLLVMFMEARGLLTEAKARGLITITDVNVAPSAETIVDKEQRRFPEWEAPVSYWGERFAAANPSFRPMEETLSQSDMFICPSEFVRDDLVGNFGVPRERTRLIPYAVNPRWLELQPTPEPGRILFAGSADLRKGIHILAEAARLLAARGRTYQFRVAGAASPLVRERPETAGLQFLGHMPFAAISEEFEKADVLALPSLAEGSAGVTYEALGNGLPQVVTRASGTPIRDGVEGLIVPERDPVALADALEAVIEDRTRRDAMARAARARAHSLTWVAFGQRLVDGVFSDGQAVRPAPRPMPEPEEG